MSKAEVKKGGKKNRKYGRDKQKCEQYRFRHGNKPGHKFTESKEHRGCGPLGYYLRKIKLHED